MRFASLAIMSLLLIPSSVFAQTTAPAPGPEIEVVDGKVSMNALGVPLSRILTMVDRAMGLKSKVAPELANRTISVRFKGLPLKEAVHKIFEGQPFNYMLIEGKGIDVSGVAVGGTTATASSSPFTDSGPITQPLPSSSTLQPAGVQVNPGQPATGNAAFPATGTTPNPQTAPATTPQPGGVTPGTIPTFGGNNNPLNPINPVGGVQPAPVTGFPSTTPPPAPQPSGPGTLPAAPGTVTPGTIR